VDITKAGEFLLISFKYINATKCTLCLIYMWCDGDASGCPDLVFSCHFLIESNLVVDSLEIQLGIQNYSPPENHSLLFPGSTIATRFEQTALRRPDYRSIVP
jgi:hypothetical protein